jgi:hypothetical protein
VSTIGQDFVVIGENIHATRVLLRKSERIVANEQGEEGIAFVDDDGATCHLRIPEEEKHSHRALVFVADLQRGRATRRVAINLGVPQHCLRLAVAKRRRDRHHGRLGRHLAIDECSVRKNFVYATVFSDQEAGVVIDLAPGQDASAVMFFAHLYSRLERARVRVVTIDCHASYRMAVRVLFRNALIVADAFHLHRRVAYALTEVCAGRPGTPGGSAPRDWAGSSSRWALATCDQETSSRRRRAGVESANEC